MVTAQDIQKEYNVVGLMSGTSLDGIDLAWVHFFIEGDDYVWRIKQTKHVDYGKETISIIKKAESGNALDVKNCDHHLGTIFGDALHNFCKKLHHKIDLIASHGHTLFHDPDNGYTFQAGNGTIIKEITSIPTVFDFRSQDVALGGQGAPLVPNVEKHLFKDFDIFLNFGGICNISIIQEDTFIGYDISPFNLPLNYLAEKLGVKYDEGGKLAASGKLIATLKKCWDSLDYYDQLPPKSLGREWVEKYFISNFEGYKIEDLLHTVSHHIAEKIAQKINQYATPNSKILATGGGVYNTFVVDLIKSKISLSKQFIIPKNEIIEYKEALCFAWLGVQRYRNKINIYSSVTGAQHDHSSGKVVV